MMLLKIMAFLGLLSCCFVGAVTLYPITSSDSTTRAEFGAAIYVSGNYLVVGAYQQGSKDKGEAYLYDCTNPASCVQHKITASDGQNNDAFGTGVSIDGTLVVVGAPGLGNGGGKAYIFDCSNPFSCVQHKLGQRSGAFGYAVSNSGTLVAVGAPVTIYGEVFLYDCSNLAQCVEHDILASDRHADDEFGFAVFLNGRYLSVGAPGSNKNQGKAYFYDCTTLTACIERVMIASDGSEFDEFGFAVSNSGTLVAVSAPYFNQNQGQVYIYDCSATPCVLKSKFTSSDGASGDAFGLSVFLSGNILIVGAPYKSNYGQAYVYNCTNPASCVDLGHLLPPDLLQNNRFGYSVAIDGSLLAVGAASSVNSFPGEVFVGSAQSITPKTTSVTTTTATTTTTTAAKTTTTTAAKTTTTTTVAPTTTTAAKTTTTTTAAPTTTTTTTTTAAAKTTTTTTAAPTTTTTLAPTTTTTTAVPTPTIKMVTWKLTITTSSTQFSNSNGMINVTFHGLTGNSGTIELSRHGFSLGSVVSLTVTVPDVGLLYALTFVNANPHNAWIVGTVVLFNDAGVTFTFGHEVVVRNSATLKALEVVAYSLDFVTSHTKDSNSNAIISAQLVGSGATGNFVALSRVNALGGAVSSFNAVYGLGSPYTVNFISSHPTDVWVTEKATCTIYGPTMHPPVDSLGRVEVRATGFAELPFTVIIATGSGATDGTVGQVHVTFGDAAGRHGTIDAGKRFTKHTTRTLPVTGINVDDVQSITLGTYSADNWLCTSVTVIKRGVTRVFTGFQNIANTTTTVTYSGQN